MCVCICTLYMCLKELNDLTMAMVDVSSSKSAQKNKKRRAKKKEKEITDADVDKGETNKEPDPVVEEPNPIEVIKQKIEEAKLAKVRVDTYGFSDEIIFTIC